MHHVGLWTWVGVGWWKCVGEWVGWAGGGYHVGPWKWVGVGWCVGQWKWLRVGWWEMCVCVRVCVCVGGLVVSTKGVCGNG